MTSSFCLAQMSCCQRAAVASPMWSRSVLALHGLTGLYLDHIHVFGASAKNILKLRVASKIISRFLHIHFFVLLYLFLSPLPRNQILCLWDASSYKDLVLWDSRLIHCNVPAFHRVPAALDWTVGVHGGPTSRPEYIYY